MSTHFINEQGHIRTLAEVERSVIETALKMYNKTEVAHRLGVGRSTLYRKLRGYHRADKIKQQQKDITNECQTANGNAA